jgi:hypothetical protein
LVEDRRGNRSAVEGDRKLSVHCFDDAQKKYVDVLHFDECLVHRVVDETRSTVAGFCRRLMAGIQGLQRYGKSSFMLFWMNRDESTLPPILIYPNCCSSLIPMRTRLTILAGRCRTPACSEMPVRTQEPPSLVLMHNFVPHKCSHLLQCRRRVAERGAGSR